VIPLTRAIPERIRGGLRRCAIQIDVYFTFTLTSMNQHKKCKVPRFTDSKGMIEEKFSNGSRDSDTPIRRQFVILRLILDQLYLPMYII